MNKTTTAVTLPDTSFQWGQLPAIPDSIGFAGSFAGVSNGALLVAGGANFPDGGAPWTGSIKKWYDRVFVLESPQGAWKEAAKLPRPLGYGVSLSWRNGVVCLGGSNESGHYPDAFILHYTNGKLETEELPDMPASIANGCGAITGDTIYVAGGTATPDGNSENIFWALDLSRQGAERRWKQLPSWPGSSRILSVAGTEAGAFYLFSGAHLKEGKREYLKDAYRYDPLAGWTRIADLPVPVVAAPTPAFNSDDGNIYIFGGDNGSLAANTARLKENHLGFSTDILSYHCDSDSWSTAGKIFTDRREDAPARPNNSVWAPVTTTLVVWDNKVVIAGGEVRPATRTPRVLISSFKKK